MAGIEITRRDLTAAELRSAAGTCRDAKASRRKLALAELLPNSWTVSGVIQATACTC